MSALSEILRAAKGGSVRDLFYIPKHGKLPESTFLVRIALSILVIFGSLGAMGLSAYAYFTSNEVIAVGTIHSADYSLEILVDDVPLSDGRLQGKAEETYKITLKKNGSAQTGFCVITVEQKGVEDVVVYHTQQIGADENKQEPVNEMSFTVTFKVDGTLKFTPHWGTSSNYQYVGYEDSKIELVDNLYITDGEPIVVATTAEKAPPADTDSTPSTTTVTTTVTAATTTTTTATEETSSTASSSSTSTSASSSTQESADATSTSTSVANTTPSEEN